MRSCMTKSSPRLTASSGRFGEPGPISMKPHSGYCCDLRIHSLAEIELSMWSVTRASKVLPPSRWTVNVGFVLRMGCATERGASTT